MPRMTRICIDSLFHGSYSDMHYIERANVIYFGQETAASFSVEGRIVALVSAQSTARWMCKILIVIQRD
jgi:hypothetical protein